MHSFNARASVYKANKRKLKMSEKSSSIEKRFTIQRMNRGRLVSVPDTVGASQLPAGSSWRRQKDRYRVVVMGAAEVGKTSIITQFLFDKFVAKYKATVEDLYKEDYIMDGMNVTMDFLDTAGSYAFPAMQKLYISTADAFILVYSVNNKESFAEVKKLRDEIMADRKDTMTPIVIVGNKTDLPDRKVTREMAETTVNIDWGNGYIEASAKDNDNVTAIFREVLYQAKVHLSHHSAMVRRRVGPSVPTHEALDGGHASL